MEISTNEGPVDPETWRENEGGEIEPINLVPNGFDEEVAIPSIPLEDFEGDKTVWLVEIPTAVDPLKLKGKHLDYSHQSSFLTDEENNERCVSIPSSGSIDLICLLKSSGENSFKTVSLNPAGKISLNICYDVPDVGAMIPDGTSVPLPTGLKVRNPFLGPGGMPSNGQQMDILKCKTEVVSPEKKSKKRKREAMDEIDELGDQVSGENDWPVGKKVKKEDVEMKGNDSSNVINADLHAAGAELETRSPAKKKTKNSKLVGHVVPLDNVLEEPKIDAESPVRTSKKEKKKKRDSQYESRPVEEFPNEVSVLWDDSVEGRKKIKKEKKQESDVVIDVSMNEESQEEISVTVDDEGQSRKKAKKKKKKRESHAGIEESVELATLGDDEIVPENLNFVKKKIKKEKRSSSHAQGEVIDVEVSQEDVSIAHDGSPEQRVKKIKREKKKDIELGTEGVVADNSQGELAVTLDDCGPIRKKSKKEKKLEILVDAEAPLTVDSAVVEVVDVDEGLTGKKIKKEKKRDSYFTGHEVPARMTSETELSAPFDIAEKVPKKSLKERKSSMVGNVNETTTHGCQEDVSITFDGVTESSKKSKKKKKRDSEIIGEVVTLDDFSKKTASCEVGGVVLENPKRKSESFLAVSDSCNESFVDFDGNVVRKKVKKEKLNSTISCLDSREGFGNFQDPSQKKAKKRHTMDNSAMEHVHLYSKMSSAIPEETFEGRSSEKKKKKRVSSPELEVCLLSPKKEKIKKEHIDGETPIPGSDSLLYASAGKKKKKRKSVQPEDI